MMSNAMTRTNWPSWCLVWLLLGLFVAISEWIPTRNPGINGTIAAIAGVAGGGLAFHLLRGGDWRFGGIGAMMGGGLIGVKSGSVPVAIAFGMALGALGGLLYRFLERGCRESGRSGTKGSGAVLSNGSDGRDES